MIIESPQVEMTAVEVVNMLGQSMTGKTVRGHWVKLPVEELSAGIYLLKVSAGGQQEVRRIEIMD